MSVNLVVNRGGEPDKVLRETINELLKNHFGTDTVTGLAMWRISWSEDQFENRLGTYEDYTPGGIYIRTVTEVRKVPKYSQWVPRKYTLENLVGIPLQNRHELPDSKMSYELMFVFEKGNGEYLPPNFEAAKFIIDSVYAAKGQQSMASYTDPEADGNNGQEAKRVRVDKLVEELFGDESGLKGAIVHGEGVGYGVTPHNKGH